MEDVVQLEKVACVSSSHLREHLCVQIPKLVNALDTMLACSELSSEALERAPNHEHIRDGCLRELGDASTLPRGDVDKPFGREHPKGLSHRRSTHAELGTELRLDEA